MKYSSSWKLQKTCSITGDAWNVFGGIVTPFTSGNVRMDMRGNYFGQHYYCWNISHTEL
ncbi:MULTISPECIES: hypothetical protein [Eubacterium]|uniref:hypothetical protein n=1 Tax=Eubacterium TaxID=1730 RepID=UPI001314D6ED|nr:MULTISPECIES: hypothetical protein [Eubacterium]MBS5621271.1 hypothetical protein [Eubacterium sp.]